MGQQVAEVEAVDMETGEVVENGAMVPALYRPAPVSFGDFLEQIGDAKALEHQQRLAQVYDNAVRSLVGPNDVQVEGDREFKKKSAWRKLGRYFRISTAIVRTDRWWEFDEDEGVRHFIARVVVRGMAPWGQSIEAVGLCSTREKRFYYKGRPNPKARMKADHDCEATAATRATNRAVSDLIAAGEVSAEEVDGGHAEDPAQVPATDDQLRQIDRLAVTRQIESDPLEKLKKRIAKGMSKAKADEAIAWLETLPESEDAAA